jgi:hypothetical protein
MRIYVASSWRNPYQPAVVAALRQANYSVYDFRNPRPDQPGFSWSNVAADWQEWSPAEYRQALEYHVACAGFQADMDAMRWADSCVLVQPCGRSAHLEAGWFVGAGRPLFVLMPPAGISFEAELMLKMATRLCLSLDELVRVLQE